MKEKRNTNKKPNHKKEPYTYSKWKRLGILSSSPVERLIVLELFEMKGIMDWLLGRGKDEWWNEKDMRRFAKDLAKKIHDLQLNPQCPCLRRSNEAPL